MERLVHYWADTALYFIGDRRYQLYNHAGEPIGDAFTAENDRDAEKKIAAIEFEKYQKRKMLGIVLGIIVRLLGLLLGSVLGII